MRPTCSRRPLFARVAMTLSLLAVASTATAADLKVGDAAPPLAVGKWVKGEPVKALDKDKVYVVEFWATWCGPCRQTIPHLSELQKKYADVVFIGQDVWERDREDTKVEPFIAEMGEKMSYRVATDDKSADETGAMAKTWMEAAGRDSIPTAFIVNKGGTIAWVGHPMSMEPVLKKVIDGSFDPAAAKKQADAEAAAQDAMEKVNGEFQAKVAPLMQKKDWPGAAKAIDDLATAYPAASKQLRGVKFGLFLQAGQYDEAYKAADQVAAGANDDPQELNALAWTIVDNKGIKQRDFDRAERYAARAVEVSGGKDAAILDTLARVYADKGDLAKAIDTQTKAVEAADGDMKADLTKTLDGYKAKQAK